jgi:hypothetical protein
MNLLHTTIIKLIPYEKFTIRTSRNKEELISVLHSKIDRKKSIFNHSNVVSFKEYEGKVTNTHFEIRRKVKIGYNGFKPLAFGKLSETNSDVNIVIRPHKLLIVLLIFATFIIISDIISRHIDWRSLVIFAIPYIMTIVYFNLERTLIKNDLVTILGGEVVDEA